MNSRVVKKSANLSIDAALLEEAKALKVGLSNAAEDGLRHAVAFAKSEQWKAENSTALESSNRWVESHGLPLGQYRQF